MEHQALPMTTQAGDNLFERLPFSRCVRRVRWLAEQCAGKNVLDIGCLDETAFIVKRGGSDWLHREIRQRARRILGVDASANLAQLKKKYPEELETIEYGYVSDVPRLLAEKGFQPELIVCGELIEHLPQPQDLFGILAPIMKTHRARLLLTTPNPYSYQAFIMALLKMESQHIDHSCMLSPKILLRMAAKHYCRIDELLGAYTEYGEFKQRPGLLKYCLTLADKLLFIPLQILRPSIAGTLLISCSYDEATSFRTDTRSPEVAQGFAGDATGA